MLGSTVITAFLGSAPPNTADTATLKAYAKALQTEAHMALFIVGENSKVPVDCRTAQAKTKATNEAAAAGLPAPNGVHMATTDPVLMARWITKYRKDRTEDAPVNMAMEVGRSGLVIVDVDTPAELDTFRQMWAEEAGDPNLLHVAPTISSPGVQNEDGSWAHHGGGHFYFTVPVGVTMPSSPGSITLGPDGATFTVYWRDRYVLIPPSSRREGTYTLTGTDHVLPEWISTRVLLRGIEFDTRKREQAKRAQDRADSGDPDGIETWDLATSWESVLDRAGWTFSGRADSCSCPIWTRPGPNPSPKSATAHVPGCSDPRYQNETPPIHVWSDNVDGGLADWIRSHSKTLSKLQFVAAVFHDGDVRKAMEAEGIRAEGGVESNGEAVSADDLHAVNNLEPSSSKLADQIMEERPRPAPTPPPSVEITSPATADEVEVSLADLFSSPRGDAADDLENSPGETQEKPSSDTSDDPDALPFPTLAPFDHWRDLPAPTYLVDGWVEDKALSMVIGPPGAGKSAVVLDMACSISMGIPWQGTNVLQGRVLYIAGEGGIGAAQRVKAWEAEHGRNVGQDLFMITEAVLVRTKDRELWPWLADQVKALGIRLVVFDTLARMSLGLEENSSSDMGNAVARFDRLRRDADTGVMVVHHTTRGQSHGRGSTAMVGAMDSEVLVQPSEDEDEDAPMPDATDIRRLTAKVTKQKNAADGALKDLTLCPRHGSIVIGDARGAVGDPFADPNVVEFDRTPAPVESATELAIRIQEYLHRLPVQGASKAEITRDVPRMSRLHRKDRDAWKAAVVTAVDRGLATGLVAVFGSDASQRYLAGSATPEDARRLDGAEADDRSGS